MATRYRFGDTQYLHFITFAVFNWIDALSRPVFKDILVTRCAVPAVVGMPKPTNNIFANLGSHPRHAQHHQLLAYSWGESMSPISGVKVWSSTKYCITSASRVYEDCVKSV